MRLKALIKGDMTYQVKYGFYLVYTILTLLYTLLLYALPPSTREKAAVLLIYTDPAAMGLFFMGAIVLLEKSQRVLNSISVSPVSASEYILAKVMSLSIIATLVGVFLSLVSGGIHTVQVIIGTLLGSAIFSMVGLIVAAKISSLNQFMMATVPFELVLFLPPMFYLFGYKNSFMLMHPGCIIIRLLSGENGADFFPILILIGWLLVIYYFTLQTVKKMFQSVGGVKL